MFAVTLRTNKDGEKILQTVPVRLAFDALNACSVAKRVMGYVYRVPESQIRVMGITPLLETDISAGSDISGQR